MLTERRIGAYQLQALLGAGGMGEVYRALDTKLGREVAIKILPRAFTADPDRLARFEREARMLAALNHPNIATIHGVEESGDVRALILELVEGETLAEKLSARALPISSALAVARQIAEALDAAHEKGIVHRDLKPANIKITPNGTVKVLDFGLAKFDAVGQTEAANDALTIAETHHGVVLGTTAYMSPEQARGLPVDKRTDIWAFGCVLYEILVGRAVFASGTISDTIAAILERQPDWNALPAATPAHVLRLLKRCLEKDPRARLRDIGDARAELDEAPQLDDQPRTKAPKAVWWFLLAAAMLIGAIAAVTSGLLWRAPPLVWAGVRLGGTDIAAIPRISPDGHTLAFAATVGGVGGPQQVAVMKPETGNRVILTHKEDGWLQCLSWSPDGTQIYYDRVTDVPRGIFRVPALGGEERLVLEDAGCPDVLSDGSLLVWRLNAQRQTQLFRFWPETGRLRGYPVGTPNGVFISAARGFPDGRQAAVIGSVIGRDTAAHLYILDLESGNVRQLSGLPDESNVLSVATTRDGKSVIAEIMAGDSVRIVAIPVNGRGTPMDLFTSTSQAATIDTGPDGSVYLEQYERPIHLLRFRAEGGHAESISPVFFPGFGLSYGALHTFAVLPDGRVVVPESISGHIRLMVIEEGKGPVPLVSTTEETTAPVTATGPGEVAFLIGPAERRAIATASTSSGRITHRISFDKGDIASLASAPDGQTLYAVANGTVWKVPVSGTELTKLRAGDAVAVSPDGRTLLVEEVQTPTIRMFRVPLDGGPEQEIQYAGPSRLAPQGNPNAIGKDGRIVTPLGTSTWHQPPGLLNPATGRLAPINIDYVTDVHSIGWSPDGEVIALGFDLRATMWRFAASGR